MNAMTSQESVEMEGKEQERGRSRRTSYEWYDTRMVYVETRFAIRVQSESSWTVNERERETTMPGVSRGPCV